MMPLSALGPDHLGAPLVNQPALHVPDGFLSVPVEVVAWLIAGIVITMASRRAAKTLGDRQVPQMGVMAAFIFAAQMITFPIGGGTSGHLLGGALAAITLGPWAGMLVLASVVAVQALLFQDGGLISMGANILNMGLITAAIGFGVSRLVAGRSRATFLTVAGVAAWLSVIGAAVATAMQLWLSGTASLGVVMPAMAGVHALIGVGEALITVAALRFVFKARPELVRQSAQQYGRPWVVSGLAAAAAAIVLAPWASVDPDGLNRVATDLGFHAKAAAAPFALMPGYVLPGLGTGAAATIAAGIIGVVVVAGVAALLVRVLRTPDGANV